MPKVTYIQPDGAERIVDAPLGKSLMDIAVQNKIVGILGECNGCLTCSTCKVFVDDAWMSKTPPSNALEQSLIDDYPANVRLSCQIVMTEALDGISVSIPANQYS